MTACYNSFFYLSYLGPIFKACLPLMNQASIIFMKNARFKKCLLKNLFLVPRFLQVYMPRYLLFFTCKVKFSDPHFCPETFLYAMGVVKKCPKKWKNSKVLLTTSPTMGSLIWLLGKCWSA